MVRISDASVKGARIAFRRQKVATIDQLADWLECSVQTARRRLKQWKAHTSYSNNGRYYVLPEVALFDADGLWRHRGIRFSQHGNLTRTLVCLVTASRAGLRAAELRNLLGLEPRSFLSQFRNHPALRREKLQGRFVYFAAEKETYREQKQRRAQMSRDAEMPSDAEAVVILVERIKHPELSAEQLASRVRKRSLRISAQVVGNLLVAHGLTGKKTPLSQP
jgi:hypothetical protein